MVVLWLHFALALAFASCLLLSQILGFDWAFLFRLHVNAMIAKGIILRW